MAPYGQFVELIIKNTGLFQQHNTGMSQAMNDSIVLHIGGDAVHICVTPSELMSSTLEASISTGLGQILTWPISSLCTVFLSSLHYSSVFPQCTTYTAYKWLFRNQLDPNRSGALGQWDIQFDNSSESPLKLSLSAEVAHILKIILLLNLRYTVICTSSRVLRVYMELTHIYLLQCVNFHLK